MVSREDELRWALATSGVVERYRAKIVRGAGGSCWIWTGAISGKGHGRFWIGPRFVIIAHRFAWALAHGVEGMPEVVGHACDNPLCQNPDDLTASTAGTNRSEWAARRHRLESPLRDTRGARGRAREIRDAARAGANLDGVIASGARAVDVDQLPLW